MQHVFLLIIREQRVAVLQNLDNVGKLVKVVFNALHGYHGLVLVIDGQRLVFDTLHDDVNLRQLSYLHEHGVVSRSCLSLGRHHLQLRVEGSEEGGHKVMEPVEDAQRYDESHSGYSHTDNAHTTDDVDGVG